LDLSLGNLHNYFFNRRGWNLLRLKSYYFSLLSVFFSTFLAKFSVRNKKGAKTSSPATICKKLRIRKHRLAAWHHSNFLKDRNCRDIFQSFLFAKLRSQGVLLSWETPFPMTITVCPLFLSVIQKSLSCFYSSFKNSFTSSSVLDFLLVLGLRHLLRRILGELPFVFYLYPDSVKRSNSVTYSHHLNPNWKKRFFSYGRINVWRLIPWTISDKSGSK
jgi:hypothetical protein